MSILKVVFITHYTNLYGANRSLLNLIEGLKSYNVSSHVIVPYKGDITNALSELDVEYAIFPFKWWVSNFEIKGNIREKSIKILRHKYHAVKRLRDNLLLLEGLAAQLKKWNIDLVYTNSSVIPVGAFVAQKLQLPHVWHLREFIDLDYNFHHDWGKKVFNYFVAKADRRIAISHAIRDYLANNCSADTTPVIYNGIASEAKFDRLYQVKKELPSKKPYTFSLVGLVHPCKGQDVAIKALSLLVKRIPETQLLIVGGGDISHLQQLINTLNVADKVKFWGHIDDPYQAYLNSDAVLMCSKNEGMGRVTVEAMSAYCPVIGYDNAGTSELIQHEHTGLLYKGEHEELAVCMQRFVENPIWAKQLGDNAWHMARQTYSIEVYARNVYQLLSSLVESSNILAKKAPKKSLIKSIALRI